VSDWDDQHVSAAGASSQSSEIAACAIAEGEHEALSGEMIGNGIMSAHIRAVAYVGFLAIKSTVPSEQSLPNEHMVDDTNVLRGISRCLWYWSDGSIWK